MSFVRVQPTPNPNARKFVLPGMRFERSRNLSSAEEAAAYPLARDLFALSGVYNVFLAQDFVTVNKLADADWKGLEAQVLAVLAEHLDDDS